MVAAQNICWAIYEWTEDNSLKWFHCVLDWKVALKRICLLPSPWNLWILPYEVEKWILQYITKDVTQMWEWDHKEGWASKHQYFQIVALEKTPESPLIARRSNQLILQEINTEYSLEGLIRKLQYFGHLMWRADSLEKPLMLGKIEGKRKSRWQRMRCLDSITDSKDMNLSKLREIGADREAWYAAVHGVTKESNMPQQLNNKLRFDKRVACPGLSRWALNKVTISLIRVSQGDSQQRQRKQQWTRKHDWSDVATHQRIPTATRIWRKQRTDSPLQVP